MWKYNGQITAFFRRHPLILVVALALSTLWFQDQTINHLGYLLTGVVIGHFYW
jgi:hypothetical protein